MKAQFAAVFVALGLVFAPVAGYAADAKMDAKADAKMDTGEKKGGVKEAVKETKQAVKETGKAIKETVEESAITTKVKAEYARDKQVSAMKIHVSTEKGVVKLTGTAKSKEEADKAESIAKATKGVVSVKNDIKVVSSMKK